MNKIKLVLGLLAVVGVVVSLEVIRPYMPVEIRPWINPVKMLACFIIGWALPR